MFCQYCLTFEISSLVNMRTKFFEHNGQQINCLDCFAYCKQIIIEDKKNAKICTNCMSILSEEYTLKAAKNEERKTDIVRTIKQEPELNIDSWCIPYNTVTKNSSDKVNYEITVADTVESFRYVPQQETTNEKTPYQIVFSISEIKQEAELLIDKNECIEQALPSISNRKTKSKVKNIVSKRPYHSWSQNSLNMALDELRKKTLTFNKCARKYNIPYATLNRHYHQKGKPENIGKKITGHPNVFSIEVERELVDRISSLENGFTINDIRNLAFQTALKHNIVNNFSISNKMAGKGWYYSFMKRNPKLVVRLRQSEVL